MLRSVTAGLLGILLLFTASAEAGAQEVRPTPDRAVVMARGEGEVTLAPDRATVFITVRTVAERPDQASTRNRAAAEAVTGALEALGLDSLRSTGVRIGPNREYTPEGPRDDGFFAERGLRASTEDLADVGKIIEAAVGAGATQIDNVSYSSSEEERARREALGKAVDNARADAGAVAAAAGGHLGEVLLLSTEGVNVPRPMYRLEATAMQADQRQELPEPEDLTIHASVEVRWAFEAEQ